MEATNYTVGEVARLYGVDPWKVRRIVDALNAELPRAGLYRLIPKSMLASIAVALKDRGWLLNEKAESEVRCEG